MDYKKFFGEMEEIYTATKFRAESLRLMRFLYGLGFDKESVFIDGKECWDFEKSDNLSESLSFYFYMREKLKSKRI